MDNRILPSNSSGEMPKEVVQLIEYLANPELTMKQIDYLMGWTEGSTRRKLTEYPELKKDVQVARYLNMREAGINKNDCYKAYVEALDAVKVVEGKEVVDHKTRIDAADRILKLYGEDILNNMVVNQTINLANLVNGYGKDKEVNES